MLPADRAADPIRVLLVDDSYDFLEQARHVVRADARLALAGWVHSAYDALRLLEAVEVDLVLIDLRMPGMNGLEATARIKREERAPKVVVVTLYDAPEYRRAAEKAGADGFVDKLELVGALAPLVTRLFAAGEERS
jgi:DNA-binding NarL/FixJ family response regulator